MGASIDIPEPAEVKRQIAIRKAEIAELREILRLAELHRARRLAGLTRETSGEGVDTEHGA